MKRYIKFSIIERSIILLLFIAIFNGCIEPPQTPKDIEDLVIAEYVDSFDLKYSKFYKLLENTRQNSLLSVRGPFTLFLPTNEAIDAYLQKKGLDSISDIDEQEQMELVKNHILRIRVSTKDIEEGAIREPNILGDKMSTRFEGSEIIINYTARITKRDIELINGIIQEVDAVIEPLTKSIYQTIKDNPAYSIFTKGLEVTGIKDTLSIVNFDFGNKPARTYFTLLAVADTIFNRYGMYTIEDAIAKFTDAPDSIRFVENGFYQFMEYHCLDGTYFLNEFGSRKNYPILSFNNNVAVEATDDYKFNYDRKSKEYVGVFVAESNVPTKNGTIHSLKDLLPVILPEPSKIEFETTNFFDLKQGDYYGKYYMKWSDGQNTFAKIKWEGDYLQYYYKPGQGGNINDDCLNMIGFFWIEVTVPKVMKGDYDFSLYVWNNWLDYDVYVDGVKTATVLSADAARETLGTFSWDKTEEHTIKIVSLNFGILFWDTVIFTPVAK